MAPTKKATKLSHLRWLLLLPIPLAWALLAHFGQLQFLENRLLDLRFRARGEIDAPVKLVYVDVDTYGVELIGEKPWSRGVFGDITAELFDKAGVKAVGFDIVFSKYGRSSLVDPKKVEEGNRRFATVIRAHPKKVVLAAQYVQGEAIFQADNTVRQLPLRRKGFVDREKNDVPEMPEPPLNHPAVFARFGLIDVDVEYSGDEVPRWVPLYVQTSAATYLHMSVQLVLLHLGLNEDAVRVEPDRLVIAKPDGSTVLTIPLHAGQLLEVNWFSKWLSPQRNPRFSLAHVAAAFQALQQEDPAVQAEGRKVIEKLKDAIVLIGPVDPLFQDLAPTPLDSHPVPKVGLHGNLVKTMLAGKYIQRTPGWVMWVAVLGLTTVVTALAVVTGPKGRIAKLGALAALGGYIAVAFYLFARSHVVLPLAAPVSAAFATSFIGVIWQLVLEEKHKGRIKGMFGAYVSPELVSRMIESDEDPQLGGHDAEITAYFSDIQSFSTFSEVLGSGPLVELMNEYLTACTDIVTAQGGTLDKYIGDAVVAMFGAPVALPDHAYRACVATQLVHAKLAELRKKWEGEGSKWPQIVWRMQSRIGLNSGQCMIGNMGSRTRFNFTMMGDNVNLAARMESGAKSWGVYTMCTEVTKRACEQHGSGRVVFRPLGRIVVKGRTQPVPIYEIVGLKENLTPQARECIEIFTAGLEKHYQRDWDGALKLFAQSRELEPNVPGKTPGVSSNPSLVYPDIIEHYRHEPPPENWDGRYVMKEK